MIKQWIFVVAVHASLYVYVVGGGGVEKEMVMVHEHPKNIKFSMHGT